MENYKIGKIAMFLTLVLTFIVSTNAAKFSLMRPTTVVQTNSNRVYIIVGGFVVSALLGAGLYMLSGDANGNTAPLSVEEATTQAETAKTKAEEAKAKAEEAKTNVEESKKQAEEAKTKTEKAEADAANYLTTITEAETKVTEVETKHNQLTDELDKLLAMADEKPEDKQSLQPQINAKKHQVKVTELKEILRVRSHPSKCYMMKAGSIL